MPSFSLCDVGFLPLHQTTYRAYASDSQTSDSSLRLFLFLLNKAHGFKSKNISNRKPLSIFKWSENILDYDISNI